jgi:hypothetical protein
MSEFYYDIKKLFSILWRPERAMLYAIATYADTSSNQAIKDPDQWRCGYSNLGKILIKFVAAKRVAATFVAERTLPGKFLSVSQRSFD